MIYTVDAIQFHKEYDRVFTEMIFLHSAGYGIGVISIPRNSELLSFCGEEADERDKRPKIDGERQRERKQIQSVNIEEDIDGKTIREETERRDTGGETGLKRQRAVKKRNKQIEK
jgi:hypothetical protein